MQISLGITINWWYHIKFNVILVFFFLINVILGIYVWLFWQSDFIFLVNNPS